MFKMYSTYHYFEMLACFMLIMDCLILWFYYFGTSWMTTMQYCDIIVLNCTKWESEFRMGYRKREWISHGILKLPRCLLGQLIRPWRFNIPSVRNTIYHNYWTKCSDKSFLLDSVHTFIMWNRPIQSSIIFTFHNWLVESLLPANCFNENEIIMGFRIIYCHGYTCKLLCFPKYGCFCWIRFNLKKKRDLIGVSAESGLF